MRRQIVSIEEIDEVIKKEEDGRGYSIEKLYEMVDTLYSHYLGLGDLQNRCITGDNNYLVTQLKTSFKRARKIDIIVSFIMESGVRLLVDDLTLASKNGAKIRILTGSYLNITQPSALYLLKDKLRDNIDLRMYNVENKSFHPKCYIIEYESDGDIFLGSSNISNSALTSGIEWNYRINRMKNEVDFKEFKSTFEDLFYNHSDILDDEGLFKYSKTWKRPKVFKDIETIEENSKEKKNIIKYPKPMGAQIEALYKLNRFREENGDKALVVAATGIGKTYLAAFDSYDFNKVLFVAHREEILKQARASFEAVRPGADYGYFSSEHKDKESHILFASVQTLGKMEYLNDSYFSPDYFDYIIIDEFHHAVADSYRNILNYFKPKFLLGLTATPERLDNKDVFVLCDYNIVYEARLKEVINKGWLVPFRYYGIYDDVDYSQVSYKNGKYDNLELEQALMINKRADIILNHYKKYNTKRALGFCTSRNHAEYMAKYFNDNGVKSCSVVSGEGFDNSMERDEAISKLNKGDINVVFSVDMFNEGLDVPSVDLVMFLRPTESSTIFLQQLGRGLRKSPGKKYLNVLDFIGNYKKANMIPFLLSGSSIERETSKESKRGMSLPKEEDFPDDCIVDFDFRIIDIFKKQFDDMKNIKVLIHEEYLRIKEIVGHRPSRLEVFTYIDDDIYVNMRRNSKLNILNDYLGYLNEIGELNEVEEMLINTKAHEFLVFIETTNMTKSYKMPVLLAFYNHGDLKMKLYEDDIYISFRDFYNKGSNSIDMTRHLSTKGYKYWGKDEYVALSKKNPQHFMAKSNPEFFKQYDDCFCLDNELLEFKDNKYFIRHFKDAIDYRTARYYRERMAK
jgi:superfamily II DNA or RNA helicase